MRERKNFSHIKTQSPKSVKICEKEMSILTGKEKKEYNTEKKIELKEEIRFSSYFCSVPSFVLFTDRLNYFVFYI